MTEFRRGPDDMGDDEQLSEIAEWTGDVRLGHNFEEEDPEHTGGISRRVRQEVPDRPPHAVRENMRLVAPDEGAHEDVDSEEFALYAGPDDDDLSAEERAMHIEPE
ncbi:DUF5709 domain-containing protein [Sphaerisporangium aureirubrum]|uniref:DUF5709 domain-containing protein n=1 Tax=Sphaerisporangium aureirubrum TaxID=1544736 RepID=A0ABW1NNK0_9ACTN